MCQILLIIVDTTIHIIKPKLTLCFLCEYGLTTPLGFTYRGNRTLSNPSLSKTVVVLRIPSLTFDAKSKPNGGFVGNPIIPLPSPLKNPAAPSLFAPSIGAVATPVTPEDNESKKN